MHLLRSHAKLNWHLEVVGRQPDGYYELRTLFQTLDLADEIVLETIPRGIELEILGAPGLTAGPENLAWRAAELYRSRMGADVGVRIRLSKRIPMGGGLGGGSSNAAAVLAGLAQRDGRAAERDSLLSIARELGADVPFFLVGGIATGRGRGDLLTPLEDRSTTQPELRLAIAPFSVSTRDVFAELSRAGVARDPRSESDRNRMDRALEGEVPRDLTRLHGWNDLEAPCFRLFPQLREVYDSLSLSGASWIRLSGSGGTICAHFADSRAADRAGLALPEGFSWIPAKPLRRAEWRKSAGW